MRQACTPSARCAAAAWGARSIVTSPSANSLRKAGTCESSGTLRSVLCLERTRTSRLGVSKGSTPTSSTASFHSYVPDRPETALPCGSLRRMLPSVSFTNGCLAMTPVCRSSARSTRTVRTPDGGSDQPSGSERRGALAGRCVSGSRSANAELLVAGRLAASTPRSGTYRTSTVATVREKSSGEPRHIASALRQLTPGRFSLAAFWARFSKRSAGVSSSSWCRTCIGCSVDTLSVAVATRRSALHSSSSYRSKRTLSRDSLSSTTNCMISSPQTGLSVLCRMAV
mmetsp:Transcript_279/g.738  ORF Transcript_279/g.738 Transcript_279/m.738 type:complete len:284 (-) Transcript_279:811-1662(-)